MTKTVDGEIRTMSSKLATTAIGWAERGLIPDGLVRAGIRALLRERLSELPLGNRGDIQASIKESNGGSATVCSSARLEGPP